MGCWHDFCIASEHADDTHVDPTGATWTEAPGSTYDPATGTYVTANV